MINTRAGATATKLHHIEIIMSNWGDFEPSPGRDAKTLREIDAIVCPKPSDYRTNTFSDGCRVVMHATDAPATDELFPDRESALAWIDREVAGLNVEQLSAPERFLEKRYSMTWPRYIFGLALTIVTFAAGLVIVRYGLGAWVGAVVVGAIFVAYSLAFQPRLPRKSPVAGRSE